MYRRMLGLLAGLCCAGSVMAASGHLGPLDPTFGDGGMQRYGFQPVGNGSHDRAVVACPGPNGTLTVLGRASNDQRIVTVRLLPDGRYDESFSGDGKESFDLPASYAEFVPGLCQPDGHLLIARPLTQAGGEQNLQVLRVLKHTGLPDPDFGTGGVVTLDLDQWLSGLASEEIPLGVNALPNGDIAVSGSLTLAAGGSRGFVALLAANGTVRTVARLDNVVSRTVTTVLEAPGGELWAFGMNGRVNGAYRMSLQRQTLAMQGLREYLAPAGHTVWVGAGRAVDAQTVVLAASGGPTPGYDGTPQLLVFRPDSVDRIDLPQARLGAQGLIIYAGFGAHGVNILPQRRVLFAAVAKRPGDALPAGIHLALAQIGTTAAGNAIDTSFGQDGAQTAAFRPGLPACATDWPLNAFARVTTWLGLPVLVGSVGTPCAGAGDEDYLVARIRTDYLFANGFD